MARKKTGREDSAALVSMLAIATEAADRLEILGNALSEEDAPRAAALLRGIDRDCLVSPDNCVAFLSVLNSPGFARHLSTSTWDNLRDAVQERDVALSEVWDLIERFAISDRTTVLAKMSLKLEICWLVSQELKTQTSEGNADYGSQITMRIASMNDPDDPELLIDISGREGSEREKLIEVLEEMDFARIKKDLWSYRIDIDTRIRLISGVNLLAYRTSTMEDLSPLALARMAQRLVMRFSLLSRTISMYPSDHPSIKPSIDSFVESISEFFGQSCNMITITVLGGELMVNNLKVKKKTRAVEDLLRHLTERRINSISFEEGVKCESIQRFITLFNRPPAWIREKGGLPKLLTSRDVQDISVGEFRFALISKDGSIVEDSTGVAVDTVLEDMIFRELIERLERGETIRGLPDDQLGIALKKVLEESAAGAERHRGLLAEFVAVLDPSILERGMLAVRDIQRNMAWSALRRIIDKCLEDLTGNDEDIILYSIEKLHDLSLTGVARNKSNTVHKIIESVTGLLVGDKVDPEVMFSGVVLLGSICERLITRGRMVLALTVEESLETVRKQEIERPGLLSSRRRAMAEAARRIDTPDVGDRIIDALLSRNQITVANAEKLAKKLILRNLATRLLDMFLEPDRSQRARAFGLLKATGLSVLPVLHSRILRLEIQTETPRDPETKRLIAEDWYVIRNIIAILGELRHASSADVLAIAATDPDDRIRASAIRALYSISKDQAYPLAMRMLGDPSTHVLRVALEVLAVWETPDDIILPRLLRLFEIDERNRAIVMKLLQSFAGAPSVQEFMRTEFKAASGVPFENVDLAKDALDCFLRSGETADIAVLRAFHDTRSGKGVFKRSGPAHDFMASVLVTIESIKKAPFLP